MKSEERNERSSCFWDDGSLVMIIEKYSQNNIEVKNPNSF
jgi:hypothetical protein